MDFATDVLTHCKHLDAVSSGGDAADGDVVARR